MVLRLRCRLLLSRNKHEREKHYAMGHGAALSQEMISYDFVALYHIACKD